MKKANKKKAKEENWVKSDNELNRKSEARKLRTKSAMSEIGKKYERVPHPTIKNTYILREKA